MNSYVIQKVIINNSGKNIYGLFYKPLLNERFPLVIYAHELANTHERGIEYAKYLASHGIGTYIFDFCGGSNNSKSDGLTTEMSVLTEEKDLESVINYFRNSLEIDGSNIFLIGASLGGLVATLYGSKYPELIKSLILLYPGFNLYDMIHKTYKTMEDVPDVFSFLEWMNVGKVFVQDAWDINPYNLLSKYDRDILIIHGDQDKIVDISYSQKALEYSSKIELYILKGANHHIFFKEYQTLAKNIILDFIQAKIKD